MADDYKTCRGCPDQGTCRFNGWCIGQKYRDQGEEWSAYKVKRQELTTLQFAVVVALGTMASWKALSYFGVDNVFVIGGVGAVCGMLVAAIAEWLKGKWVWRNRK